MGRIAEALKRAEQERRLARGLSGSRAGETAWLYLFESDGSLDPGAGQNPVAYDFVPFGGASDLEDSEITTPAYRVHSTVTLFARFRGWSTLQPRRTAM